MTDWKQTRTAHGIRHDIRSSFDADDDAAMLRMMDGNIEPVEVDEDFRDLTHDIFLFKFWGWVMLVSIFLGGGFAFWHYIGAPLIFWAFDLLGGLL